VRRIGAHHTGKTKKRGIGVTLKIGRVASAQNIGAAAAAAAALASRGSVRSWRKARKRAARQRQHRASS